VEIYLHASSTLTLAGGKWFSFKPMLLYPWGRSQHYLLDRRLGGPQNWCGCNDEDRKYLLCHCWELNPSHPSCSLFTALTELPQVSSWTCRCLNDMSGNTEPVPQL